MKTALTRAACVLLLACGVAAAQTPPPSLGTCGGQTVTFKDVRLPQAVLANGTPLQAGAYEIRITADRPAPATGQSAAGECWVEFVKNGAVAGREVASVIPGEEIATIAKGPAPKAGGTRVEPLKGGEYLRVWMNSAGTHYLVNLAVPAPR